MGNLQNDIQQAIEKVKEMRQKEFEESKQLSLGDLISRIEHLTTINNLNKKNCAGGIVFDFYDLVPTELISYRGYYNELALECDKGYISIIDFLNLLKSAIGKEFYGYKGGTYIMDKETPVWVSAYGESSSTIIVDAIYDGHWSIRLITQWLNDYI